MSRIRGGGEVYNIMPFKEMFNFMMQFYFGVLSFIEDNRKLIS